MPLPDSDSFVTYGGSKINYSAPVNPNTDYDATLLNLAFCNVAEITRTVPRAYVRFTGASTTGNLILVNWDANWKGATTTAPILARSGTGIYTITFPTEVGDENGGSHNINFVSIYGVEIEGTVELVHGQASLTSANIITLYTFNVSGAAMDMVGINCNVILR